MQRLMLLTGLLCLATLRSVGQQRYVGMTVGTTYTPVTFPGLQQESNQWGTSMGLSYDRALDKHWWISSGLQYQQWKYQARFYDIDPYPPQYNYAIFRRDYLAAPIKFTVQGRKQFYPLASIGIVPTMLLQLSGKVPVYDSIGKLSGYTTVYATKGIEPRFDVAGLFELGVGYRTGKGHLFYLSGAYQRSFKDLLEVAPYRVHYGYMLSAGFKYKLRAPQKPRKVARALGQGHSNPRTFAP